MKTEIIYEDTALVVCYKPAGIPTQTAAVGVIDCVHEIKNYLKTSYVALINRLDQPVEGLVLMAKTKEAAASLNRAMTEGKIEKKYYALLKGTLEKKEATLTDYLIKDGKTNRSKIVKKEVTGAKKATLSYRELEKKVHTLVEIKLETGRHHQIRVQMAHLGNPLLGDGKYGERANGENLSLCAYQLVINHPETRKRMTFQILPKNEEFIPYIGKLSCVETT